MNRKIIPYKKQHRTTCVEIFKSNIGKYFDDSELKGFEDFLDNHVSSAKYFIVISDDKVIGCGGYYLRDGVIRFVNGMIEKKALKTGAGVFLLEHRLTQAKEEYPDKSIGIDTSQHTEGFFRKYGFTTTNTVKDFYGKGIDKVSMVYHP